MSDFKSKTFTPGFINRDRRDVTSKETLRLDQLVPANIMNDSAKLNMFMKAYYEFMNLDNGFTYIEEVANRSPTAENPGAWVDVWVTYGTYIKDGAASWNTRTSMVYDTDGWHSQNKYID